MVVQDILPNAKKVFGKCESPILFDGMTRAVELLANQSVAWDAMIRNITITTEEDGTFALPPDIETPLGVQLDGFPAFNRDKWFIFHINGPGKFSSIDGWRSMWDDIGDSPIIRAFPTPSKLKVGNVDPLDEALAITVFGEDDSGNPLKTGDDHGLTINAGTTSSVTIARITYVTKPISSDVMTLSQEDNTLLGSYQANDTSPKFRIVRFPRKTVVTIQYRVRTLKLTSVTDYIPLDDRNSFIASMRAIKYLDDDKPTEFATYREIATQLANAEQETRNAQSAIGPQVQNLTTRAGSSLWGGRGARGGRGRGCC